MSREGYKSLKRLRGEPKQHPMMAFDTEDDQLGFGRRSGFYLGVVVSEGERKVFRQRWRLIEYLTQPRWAGYWCAAHNLEYDVLNLWSVKEVARMDPTFSGSKLCGIRLPVRGRNGFVTLWDTSCFMPQSLAKLAPLVGMEKLEMEHRPGKRTITPQEKEYAVRDTEIEYALANYIQDGANTLGAELKLTAAATSMDLFRRRYQVASLPCLPMETQLDMMRGYYGGRVECLRLGEYEGEFYGNDFNGMYVSVMIDSNLPEIDTFRKKLSPDLTKEGMLHAEVEVPDHLWAAPLPHRSEETGKLTFPVGKMRGWWTYNEMRVALNSGVRIGRVFDCYHSERCEPYLREMMIKLRGIREDPATPKPVSQLAKLLGNSLYGKFAQRVEDYEFVHITEWSRMCRCGDFEGFNPDRVRIYPDFQLVRMERPVKFARHSNVIWGACITGGARTKLLAHLDEDTSYYCDTDSVLGERRYPETKQLGALALKDEYAALVIRGNKFYAGFSRKDADWECHVKGVPRSQAFGAVLCPDNPVTSRRPIKFRSALSGRGRANAWIEITKRQSLRYDKRVVLPDGRTRPLVLGMEAAG